MLFQTFDDDNSGTLEVCEMYKMFCRFGFEVSQTDMKKLFDIVNLQDAGRMDLEEFKNFMTNEWVTVEFKRIMKNLKKHEQIKIDGDRKRYFPTNFNSMLNYIHN